MSPSYISEIERGLKHPSLKTVQRIAAALQLPVSQLLEEGRSGKERHPALGEKIRRRRSQQGLTQAALAEMTAVTPGLIGQIESGGTDPSLPLLEAIARALGLPAASDLLTDGEDGALTAADLPPRLREALAKPPVREIVTILSSFPDPDLAFILSLVRLYRQSFTLLDREPDQDPGGDARSLIRGKHARRQS